MSEIAFNDIPANIRNSGVYVEFDNRLAGNAVPDFKLLVIGQRLAAGTVAANLPTRASQNATLTEEQYGRGSMAAEMVKAIKAAQPWLETWVIALDDNVAGAAATGTITVTGSPTEAGTLNVYIAGKRVQAVITSGQTPTQVAAAIVAAITADTTLPVTASAVAGVVTLTARHKGECGNTIDVRLNYYEETTPKGITVAIVAMSGGTGNPDISTAIAAMGDVQYNWIALPYTDAANLALIEAELDARYKPPRQIGGRAFCAFRGTHAATGTFGNTRNSPHVSCMGTGMSPTPPYLWAAVNAAVGGFKLMNDPARQLRTALLVGVKAPAPADRFTDTERNELLFDGISTYTVGPDGTVRIAEQITMYQLNTSGIGDDSYLYINTVETLERYRFEQRYLFSQKYPDWKLAKDTEVVGPGQPVMQPKLAKVELLGLYKRLQERGWVQDYERYKESLVSQINGSNPNRLDIYDSPILVGNLRVTAIHVEFRTQ